ncbi:MAG: 2,3-bisphosphoglycerate-independent phosphoglycerate mutase, partial [Natronomonas sp.]
MRAALVILDGWGLGPGDDTDAVSAAETPTVDRLRSVGAAGTLETHGRRVGLPEGQMGNSEVGHLNIGAGRVVTQASTRISDAIAADELADNEAISEAFEYADRHDGRVHFLGLLSDGGVHSYQKHLHALLEAAADYGVEAVTHPFTDGRDTDPTGGVEYVAELESKIESIGTG